MNSWDEHGDYTQQPLPTAQSTLYELQPHSINDPENDLSQPYKNASASCRAPTSFVEMLADVNMLAVENFHAHLTYQAPQSNIYPDTSSQHVADCMNRDDAPFFFQSAIDNTAVPHSQNWSSPPIAPEPFLDASPDTQPLTCDDDSIAESFDGRHSWAGPIPSTDAATNLSQTPQPVAFDHTFESSKSDTNQYDGRNTYGTQDPNLLGVPPFRPGPLQCSFCNQTRRTQAALKKHENQHRKPCKCPYEGCNQSHANTGFATNADLNRHIRSKHHRDRLWICHREGCAFRPHEFPRDDNFRQHLVQKHHLTRAEARSISDQMKNDLDTAASTPCTSHDYSIGKPQHIDARAMDVRSSGSRDLESSHAYDWTQESLRGHNQPSQILEDFAQEPMDDLALPQAENYDNIPIDPVRPLSDYMKLNVIEEDMQAASNPNMVRAQYSPKESSYPGAPSGQTFYQSLPLPTRRDQMQMSYPPVSGATAFPQTCRHTDQGDITGNQFLLQETTSQDCSLQPERVLYTAHTSSRREERASSSFHPRRTPRATVRPTLQTQSTKGTDYTNPSSQNGFESQECDTFFNDGMTPHLRQHIRDLGYDVVKKPDPNSPESTLPSSPPGSSSACEPTRPCPTCFRLRDRKSELTKHQRRHTKPYFCTDSGCNYSCGSKADIKRHENNQHCRFETWVCSLPAEINSAYSCLFTTSHRDIFRQHIEEKHRGHHIGHVTSKDFVASCRHFNRNVPRKFWCGFCNECLGIDGDDAEKRWDARFDHIEDHILGRNGLKEVRADKWQPKPLLDSMVVTRVINQPSRARAYTHPQGANVTRPVELTESYPTASSQWTASASIAGIKSLKRQATLSPLQQTHEMKRSNSSSTLPSRPRTPAQETPPRQETARAQRRLNTTTRVYCCSCQKGIGNYSLDVSCSECQHRFCNRCQKVREEVQDRDV